MQRNKFQKKKPDRPKLWKFETQQQLEKTISNIRDKE